MPLIGEIKLWSADWAPLGWRFCDGSRLDIWEANVLACVIGDRYGSLENKTFELPNLEPVPDKDGRGVSRYIICVEGEFPRKP